MTNWPFVSACHAGRLGDHPTPVGSAEIASSQVLPGFVRFSRHPLRHLFSVLCA
jgi:hypothetical protein